MVKFNDVQLYFQIISTFATKKVFIRVFFLDLASVNCNQSANSYNNNWTKSSLNVQYISLNQVFPNGSDFSNLGAKISKGAKGEEI